MKKKKLTSHTTHRNRSEKWCSFQKKIKFSTVRWFLCFIRSNRHRHYFRSWCPWDLLRSTTMTTMDHRCRCADVFRALAIDDWSDSVWFSVFYRMCGTCATSICRRERARCVRVDANCWRSNSFYHNAGTAVPTKWSRPVSSRNWPSSIALHRIRLSCADGNGIWMHCRWWSLAVWLSLWLSPPLLLRPLPPIAAAANARQAFGSLRTMMVMYSSQPPLQSKQRRLRNCVYFFWFLSYFVL